MTEKGITIKIVETECALCGAKIRDFTEEKCALKLKQHIETDCKTVKTLKEWDNLGVRNEMLSLLKGQKIDVELKRLMKKYKVTKEEIVEALEYMEME